MEDPNAPSPSPSFDNSGGAAPAPGFPPTSQPVWQNSAVPPAHHAPQHLAQTALEPMQPASPYISPETPTPPPMNPVDMPVDGTNDKGEVSPLAVVQVLSTRGVEYTMLTLCLWFGAIALLWIFLALANGGAKFAILALPVSLLIVCAPVFGYLFLRLKKAELANPALRFDPSKRRLTQFTQIIAFAACLFNVIAFVYLILTKIAGQGGTSMMKDILNLLIILIIAGGVLAYYWLDEHRQGR